MEGKFRKRERIKKKQEFKIIIQEGNFLKFKYYNFFFKKNNLKFSRLGIIVKKYIGCAVIRNYEKRLIREFFRSSKNLLKDSIDFIVFIKQKEKSFFKKREDFLNVIKKINKLL